MAKSKTVIALGPHPDDVELGCGGFLAKCAESGMDVRYICFSYCEESVPESFPPNILKKEIKKSMRALGILPERLISFDFRVRRFNELRQDILEKMIKLRNELKPDLVLLPSMNDIHQDHAVIAQEGVRAFKHSDLLGYELPWNNISFTPTYYVSLTKRELRKKLSAVAKYISQSGRRYTREGVCRGLAEARGVQAGAEYAEAFEVIRMYCR